MKMKDFLKSLTLKVEIIMKLLNLIMGIKMIIVKVIILRKIDSNIEKSYGIKWLKNNNNSCRFDVFYTCYLFCLYEFNESNYINFKNNEGIIILHNTLISLYNNINSEDRYNFWSYANSLQIDRGINKVEFSEIGYLSGLFSIFNNLSYFCIEYEKMFNCCICNKIMSEKIFYKNLISLNENDLVLNRSMT